MASVADTYFQQQLTVRKERLEAVHAHNGASPEIARLVAEVDAALARIDNGTFGICEVCGGALDTERLIADPLARVCLEELPAEELRRIQADLEMAGRIQRALLPPQNLAVHGWEVHYRYEPVGHVSGDYCDLIVASQPAGELFFLLGDVVGKGVAASLLMSHLHAMFRSLVTVRQPLAQMLCVASRLFSESTVAGQYATLVAGRAGSAGHVEIAGAGHPPALLLNTAGVTRIESCSFPLGMFADAPFTTQEFDLSPGDSLLFYSDGVTESHNGSGEEFGVARLEQFAGNRRGASPADLVGACFTELRSFCGSQPRADDVTVMALRRSM